MPAPNLFSFHRHAARSKLYGVSTPQYPLPASVHRPAGGSPGGLRGPCPLAPCCPPLTGLLRGPGTAPRGVVPLSRGGPVPRGGHAPRGVGRVPRGGRRGVRFSLRMLRQMPRRRALRAGKYICCCVYDYM